MIAFLEGAEYDEALRQMGAAPLEPGENPGPGRGGRRANAGRRTTDLRSLDIGDTGIDFNEPVEYTADVTITLCGSCNAVSWQPYTVIASAITAQPPDEHGFCYPVLATVQMPGRVAKHSRNCPNK